MLYKNYQTKIEKIAKIVDKIKKHKVLILSVIGAILALYVAFLSVRGIFTDDINLSTPQIVYGQRVECSAGALFSKVGYEHKLADGNEWIDGLPTQTGDYSVRAYSKRTFGIKNYSRAVPLVIEPASLDVQIKENNLTYGDMPTYVADLKNGDKISQIDYNLQKTVGTQKISALKDSIVIQDKLGNDVTHCYNINASEKNVYVAQKRFTFKVADENKTYDGKELTFTNLSKEQLIEQGKIALGELAFDDKIEIEFNKSITNVGFVENTPVFAIKNADGQDVSANYNINKQFGTLEILPRPFIIKVNEVSKEYDGTPLTFVGENIDTLIESGKLMLGNVAEGDRIDVEFTKSIINAVTEQNTPDYDILNSQGESVISNYVLTEDFGNLKITPKPFAITVKDQEKVYDGMPLTFIDVQKEELISQGKIELGQLADDDNIEIVFDKSIIDVDEIQNTPIYYITNAYGNSVISNYLITENFGNLKITPKPLTITVFDDEKVYDGTELTFVGETLEQLVADNKVYYSELGFGDRLDIQFSSSITDVNSVDNVPSYSIKSSSRGDLVVTNNYKITDNFEDCKLTVTPRPIRLKFNNEKNYDGYALLMEDDFEFISGELVDSHYMTVCSNDVKAKTYGKESVDLHIFEPTKEVTTNYQVIIEENSALIINKRDITIKSYDGSAIYNAEPFTLNEYVYYNMPSDHTLDVSVTGSITDVGSAENTIIINDIKNQNNESALENFNCTVTAGTLTVTPRQVYVFANAVKTYDDSAEIPVDSVSVSVLKEEDDGVLTENLYGNQKIRVEKCKLPTGCINAGTYLESVKILEWDIDSGNKNNYNITINAGDLTIEKRPLTIKTPKASIIYDGQVHTFKFKDGVIDQEGLVDGHKIELNDDWTELLQGSGPNEVTVKDVINSVNQTVIENYEIIYEYGEITVGLREISLVIDENKQYNGQEFYATSIDYAESSLEVVDNHTIKVWTDGVNVGEYKGEKIKYYIFDEDGNDCSSNYIVLTDNVQLEITKRELTVNISDFTKVYDGGQYSAYSVEYENNYSQPFALNQTQTITVENLLDEHVFYADLFSSAINVDDTNTTITIRNGEYRWRVANLSADGEDQTQNYVIKTLNNGKLTITPKEITIKVNVIKTYDDTASLENTSGNIAVLYENGELSILDMLHSISVECSSTEQIIDAGEYLGVVKCDSYKITDYSNQDVTKNYQVNADTLGDLTINQLSVYLYSDNMNKEYDGTPLTNDKILVNEDYGNALIDGHKIVPQDPSNLPFALTREDGRVDNKISYKIIDAFGNDKTGNYYEIAYDYGTLSIDLTKISIVIFGYEAYYNGQSHAFTGRKFVVEKIREGYGQLAEGDEILGFNTYTAYDKNSMQYVDQIVNAGEYEVGVDLSSMRMRYNGQEVGYEEAENYVFEVTSAQYVIRKQEVYLTANSITSDEPIDSEQLQDAYTITYGKFMAGDEVKVYVSGSCLEKGTSTSNIWYVEVDGERVYTQNEDVLYEDLLNYNIKVFNGTLTYN